MGFLRSLSAWYASNIPPGWVLGITSIFAFITQSWGEIIFSADIANYLGIAAAVIGLGLVGLYFISKRMAKIRIGLIHPEDSCTQDELKRNLNKQIDIDEWETAVRKCCINVPSHLDEYMIEFSENSAYSLGIGGLDGPPAELYGNRIYCDQNYPRYDFQLRIEPLSSGTSEMEIKDIHNNVTLGKLTISLPDN